MIQCFDYHCQGESHKVIDKVCQDYTYSKVSDEYAIAVVCDGHGGKRYFRSDVGARLATEITADAVEHFVNGIGTSLFVGKSYTAVEAITTEIQNEDFRKIRPEDKALRQLFGSILFQWNNAVRQHAADNPITVDERRTVEQHYIDEFYQGDTVEKLYGCTLMFFVRTDSYWLGVHLGDGKCVSINADGDWKEPIPWDDRCFLNRTTSICDNNAINEFRYCYCGDGSFPVAVFLGSDGMDDSFGEEQNLVNFYFQVAKGIAVSGRDAVVKDVQESLPHLSKIGSQDDMSLACVYDSRINDALPNLIKWQINYNRSKIFDVNRRIRKAWKTISSCYTGNDIDLHYAHQDIQRCYEEKAVLERTVNKFLKELHGPDAEKYKDELGHTIKCLTCGLRHRCLK